MAAYKIITDSCADFTQKQYRELDVDYAPLSLLLKGELHENFTENHQAKSLYDAMRAGEMPTTSAANPDGWAKVMEPYLKEGMDILCLTFSSALSTTYQSAVIAGQELGEQYPDRKIIVIDSRCAALGQGLLVWYTCRQRDAGLSLEELAAWVEENKLRICHWVTVDDLFHLKRGGRVSATTAIVGTMLNVKPIIHVNNEGQLISVAKVRGRKAAMDTLVKKYEQHVADRQMAFIAHGDCPEEAAELEAILKERCGVQNTMIGYVGGVIGAHTGPGVLVVFFLGDHR